MMESIKNQSSENQGKVIQQNEWTAVYSPLLDFFNILVNYKLYDSDFSVKNVYIYIYFFFNVYSIV